MQNTSEQKDLVNIKVIFNSLIEKWQWFLISIVLCILIAYFCGKYTSPVYEINAKLLVNDSEKGSSLAKTSGLMDLGGLLGSSNSIDNEIEILKTRFLMEQVVRKMQLNIVYSLKSGLKTSELYQAPFKVTLIKTPDTIPSIKFSVQQISSDSIRLVGEDFEKIIAWDKPINIDGFGSLTLSQSPGMKIGNQEYIVDISSIDNKVSSLSQKLSVSVSNKMGSVVDLRFLYGVPRKGEDILNAIIFQYNQGNLSDKNAIADSTYKFIKERLNVIASELGDVEDNEANYKQQNQLADMSEQGKLLVQTTNDLAVELAKTETQVSILNDLESYLKDESKNKRVFPSSLLPNDAVFSGLMAQYNSLLVERDKQLLGLTEESPFIKNIDSQIEGLRKGILGNIQNTKNSYLATRNNVRSRLRSSENQISGVPTIEKNYLKLARNKGIKQELYIFLMQKAEETAISKTSNISVSKVIDPSKSEVAPVSPKKSILYFFAILAGVFLPVTLIFGRNLLNNKITTKEDISSITNIPVIGEINHNDSDDNLIVANNSRSAISEQFRALRTNLSFYLKNDNEKVILLTSSMSGEGKSFTAINLGNILALAGKKVLLMELDLRKPGLSAKLNVNNSVGFSNYTITPNLKIDDLIKPLAINKNMYIISSGPLPPNPAETLMSEHTATLMHTLKNDFDYIIMDAPPIGVITDAQLLSPYADVTLYLVRQKVTQKEQIKIVEELYQSGKMKNLGIVVNDIIGKYYGYGYGYGNYGAENKSSSLFSRIFFKGK